MTAPEFRCGYIALVGRPNVGKSTLLNRLLGQKISITSKRPQTTRHRILGIKTLDTAQFVYVDTPGLHRYAGRAMNRQMNREATRALQEVDIVVFMVEGLRWTEDDDLVLKELASVSRPVVLAVNKVDLISDKQSLLPGLQSLSQKRDFAQIIPLSASRGQNVAELEAVIESLLPESGPFFPEDQVTDRSERFLVAERVREKLFRKLGKELPYGLTVEIERVRAGDRFPRWVSWASWSLRAPRSRAALPAGGQYHSHPCPDLGRAAEPEGNRHRPAGAGAQGGRPGGANRDRIPAGQQGQPQALGQGEGRLGG